MDKIDVPAEAIYQTEIALLTAQNDFLRREAAQALAALEVLKKEKADQPE